MILVSFYTHTFVAGVNGFKGPPVRGVHKLVVDEALMREGQVHVVYSHLDLEQTDKFCNWYLSWNITWPKLSDV